MKKSLFVLTFIPTLHTTMCRWSGQDITDLDMLNEIFQLEATLVGSDTLSTADSLLLTDALYTTTSVVSERALDLLIAYGGYKYFEPIIEGEGAEPRSLIKPALQQPENSMFIYPNPAEAMVIVEYKPAGIASIELVDLNGRVVQHALVNTAQHQFSLNLN